MGRVSTHTLGVNCLLCHDVLEPDKCQCGELHGYTYQHPTYWAARTWPRHACFRRRPPEGWYALGQHADSDVLIELSTDVLAEDGLPMWERPLP